MKLRIKKKVTTEAGIKSFDERKAAKLHERMKKVSEINRRRELSAEKKALVAKKREDISPASPPLPTTKVTVTGPLNIRGDSRGMGYSSEHFRKIRKMRKFYNKQMPVLACSSCAFQTQCPQFKAGYECAFLPFLNAHKVENSDDLLQSLKDLAEANLRRAHQATIMETLSGGTPSMELSESMNLLFQQLLGLEKRMSERDQVNMQIETNDQTIIGKLFGSLDSLVGHTKAARATPIDVPPIRLIENKVEETLGNALKKFDNSVNEELIREHSKQESVS